jgi:tetratricopeptide (TPR) repeat protein
VAYLKADFTTDYSTDELKAAAMAEWYRMIEVEANTRRDDKVLAAYNAMLKIFGSSDDILGRLGNYHAGRQRYEQARAIYRKFKDQVQGLSRVAASYRGEKKPAEAIKIYRQLAGQDRENAASWKGQEAATHRESGQYPEAIKVYRELLQTDAANVQTWLWALATTQRDAGLLKEAIGAFRQCENFPENYRQMADCHLRLKQYKEALVLYGQIRQGHEALAPWAQLQIGYTYERLKATEPAIKAFQLCCKKYPTASSASKAHAHLQNKYKISVTLGGATKE